MTYLQSCDLNPDMGNGATGLKASVDFILAVLCITDNVSLQRTCLRRKSTEICRLKRTPLPVLPFTCIPDRNKCRCAENLV